MSRLAATQATQQAATAKAAGGLSRRKCACGTHTIGGAECDGCAGEGRKLKRASVNRAEASDVRPDARNIPHPAHGFARDLSRIPSRSEAPATLQTKLALNEPGDAYEKEADRIAEQVAATYARPALSAAPPRIRRFSGQPSSQAGAAPPGVERAVAGPGRALEPSLRRDMEHLFGHDFGRVRVHTGAGAAASAESLGALAYAAGRDVVFGEGRYAPGTAEGLRLLAHELTHVVQQGDGAASPTTVRRQPDPRKDTERELRRKEARLAYLQQRIQALSDDFVRLKQQGLDLAPQRKRRADERAKRTEKRFRDDPTVLDARTLDVLRRAIKIEQTQTTIKFVATIEITYLGLTAKEGSAKAATDMPRIAQAIRDAWTVGLTEGEYKGVAFSVEPRITFRAPSASRNPNAWQIEVRERDDKQGTQAMSVAGVISMNPAHLDPARVRVIGHELFHMFGEDLDMYIPADETKKPDPKVAVSVGRQDPKGRPDLRGITDPVVLKRWLAGGYITQADVDRQSRTTAKVWEEELERILNRMDVMTPRAFQMEQIAQQTENNVKRYMQERMESNTVESLKLMEEAMQLEQEVAALRARLGTTTPKQTSP